MTDLWKQVRKLAATVTVISALFFVLSVGIGTTYDVLTDPELVEMNAAQFTNGAILQTQSLNLPRQLRKHDSSSGCVNS